MVCLPEAAARRIDADLKRYPLVLRENNRLRSAVASYAYGARLDSVALVAADSAQVATQRQVGYALALSRDARAQAAVYQLKARKRSWVVVGLSALLVAVTYAAVAR